MIVLILQIVLHFPTEHSLQLNLGRVYFAILLAKLVSQSVRNPHCNRTVPFMVKLSVNFGPSTIIDAFKACQLVNIVVVSNIAITNGIQILLVLRSHNVVIGYVNGKFNTYVEQEFLSVMLYIVI